MNQHSQASYTNPSNVSTTSSPTQPSSNELSNSISDGAPQVEVGDYVAVYLDKYDPEQPQIRKITSISSMDETVDIEWYMGCYSGIWKVCMIGRGTTRKVWSVSVPFTAILRSI